MKYLTILFALLAGFTGTGLAASHAVNRTPSSIPFFIKACRGDAKKLCNGVKPAYMLSCLKVFKKKTSALCHAELSKH